MRWWGSRRRDKNGRSSSCADLCGQLVGPFPGIFKLHRGSRPALVSAAAGDPGKLSGAAGVFPIALESDLSADRGDLSFKRAQVTISVSMLVNKVAALGTASCEQVCS